MIPDRSEDSPRYPRYEKTPFVPLTFGQWGFLFVVACLPSLLGIMAPSMPRSLRVMVLLRTTPELVSAIGVLILPFLFGRGSMAREALSRARIPTGWTGIGSGLIMLGLYVVSGIAQQRGIAGIFGPFTHLLDELRWSGPLLSSVTRYLVVPIFQIAAWTFLVLLMLSHPKWKLGLILVVGFELVNFALRQTAYQLQSMMIAGRYGDSGLPLNLDGWFITSIVSIIAITACTCALARAFRASLMPVAVLWLSIELMGRFIEMPWGFYNSGAAIVGALLVFFVWANQERFGELEDESGGLEMKVEA
ncbi:MAG: hypothetical protein JST12_06090 [Armatimonadetes bacterium]|nr:hypothetical protein [Armatimonadota bacterium]